MKVLQSGKKSMLVNKSLKTGIIAALAVLGLMAAGCATIIGITVEGYAVTDPAPPGTLRGQKALVFTIAMAERLMPSAYLLNDIEWIDKAKRFEGELASLQAEKLSETYRDFTAAYRQAFGAETVEASYDFGGVSPDPESFYNPDAVTRETIARACASTGVEYAVMVIERIDHGATARPFLLPGFFFFVEAYSRTKFYAYINVFDKAGNRIAHGDVVLPAGLSADGFEVYADSADDYIEMFDAAKKALVSLAPLLEEAE
jgi:hypothetical protein